MSTDTIQHGVKIFRDNTQYGIIKFDYATGRIFSQDPFLDHQEVQSAKKA